MTRSQSTAHSKALQLVHSELNCLRQEIARLCSDVRLIKGVLLRQEENRRRKLRKLRQKQRQLAKEKAAVRRRSQYESFVWSYRRRPWDFMPDPTCDLNRSQLYVVSLLSRLDDKKVAKLLRVSTNNIKARIWAMKKKLGLESLEELIAYYESYRRKLQSHRRRRCFIVLSRLLYPPPGYIDEPNLKLTWLRKIGDGGDFVYAGPYVSPTTFDWCEQHQHNVLKLQMKGLSRATIAKQLNINERSVGGYFSLICGTIERLTGVRLSPDDLPHFYRQYLKKRNR